MSFSTTQMTPGAKPQQSPNAQWVYDIADVRAYYTASQIALLQQHAASSHASSDYPASDPPPKRRRVQNSTYLQTHVAPQPTLRPLLPAPSVGPTQAATTTVRSEPWQDPSFYEERYPGSNDPLYSRFRKEIYDTIRGSALSGAIYPNAVLRALKFLPRGKWTVADIVEIGGIPKGTHLSGSKTLYSLSRRLRTAYAEEGTAVGNVQRQATPLGVTWIVP
jgi:hypothetical protein